MKLLKKLLKGLLYFILFLLMLFVVLYLVFHKPKPSGETGERAIALVEKMQNAINQTAWDTTRYVEWTFMDRHHFVWDKERHYVQVEWGKNRVLLDPDSQTGVAFKNGDKVEDPGLIKKANLHFTNDAFWFNAPAQMSGSREVKLEAISLENQQNALLITYLSGGVTPGDSYLWILDESGLPIAWQMWVKFIPIGGIEFKWKDWVTLETGAKIATTREGLQSLSFSNIKTYQEAEEDIFAYLEDLN